MQVVKKEQTHRRENPIMDYTYTKPSPLKYSCKSRSQEGKNFVAAVQKENKKNLWLFDRFWSLSSQKQTAYNPEGKKKKKKEKKGRRHNSPRLQTILQSYSNKTRVVLAYKQTYRSVEQNKEPRNKPIHLQ